MSPKIVGIGLNKTGTKTLGQCFEQLGLEHKTYSARAFDLYRANDHQGLREIMDRFDSFEDWPWPLLYREIDQWYPDARYVLTERRSPEVWYRSLCNMAVRRGPLEKYEQHIYGHSMPQGHGPELKRFYTEHNRAVREYFADRPEKLVCVCWEHGDGWARLGRFLDQDLGANDAVHTNRSSRWIYSGDSLLLAHLNRVVYQTGRRARATLGRYRKRLRQR